MAIVKVANPNTGSGNFELLPETIMNAVIEKCEYPSPCPWEGDDTDNIGVNFTFRIDDDEYTQHRGRKQFLFCTTTPDKPFDDRFQKVMKGLGVEEKDGEFELDPEALLETGCAIRIGAYTNKAGTARNSVEEVFQR